MKAWKMKLNTLYMCMFSKNDIGDSNKTKVKQAKHFGKYLAAKMEIGC